jgi:hypothetical protein
MDIQAESLYAIRQHAMKMHEEGMCTSANQMDVSRQIRCQSPYRSAKETLRPIRWAPGPVTTLWKREVTFPLPGIEP